MIFRWLYFLICVVFGLVLLAGGLLVPAHLRALDAMVIRNAGRNGSSLLEEIKIAAGEKRLGTAQQLLRAAQIENSPGANRPGLLLPISSAKILMRCFGATARAWKPFLKIVSNFRIKIRPLPISWSGRGKATATRPWRIWAVHSKRRRTGIVAQPFARQNRDFFTVEIGFRAGIRHGGIHLRAFAGQRAIDGGYE